MVSLTKNNESTGSEIVFDLRNPYLAGALAWLFPGAGHWYQRRYFKAAVFALCIWPILIAGLFMGSYSEETPGGRQFFFARDAYCSFRPGDKRLYFIPQACVGCVALPAIWRARFPVDADGSFWSAAFAPPRLPSESQTRPNQPDLNALLRRLHSWFDLGTLYVAVAGILNLLAFFDAVGGPAPAEEEEEGKDEKKDKKRKEKNDSSDKEGEEKK
ncbi:MAG: hypothetical protein IJM30_13215 [Thermoguttaceae bacterium]|nr:hypothetical protein [Thermoguttaceae bacterium]